MVKKKIPNVGVLELVVVEGVEVQPVVVGVEAPVLQTARPLLHLLEEEVPQLGKLK